MRQQELLTSTLILNPVENIPFKDDLAIAASPLHGLYNSDKERTRTERMDTPIQFAGRQAMEADSRAVYEAWATALHAEDATLRLLSGLHAHVVLFMSIASPGQTALVLPVKAGGHMSGTAILQRLGLIVHEMPVNNAEMCVDIERTVENLGSNPPDYILVDRSEGLIVEDFSGLILDPGRTTAIFDASQYLTNVICGDHPNPFDDGFDLILASVHKNFPGPQKALLATRSRNNQWTTLLKGVSTYVSNMHVASTYAAGLTLTRSEWLRRYSREMLAIAVRLEDELIAHGVPAVKRPSDRPPTHHIWIQEAMKEKAFETYEALERCRILTNFRLLPYSLGYGLRLGTSAAARIGLKTADVPRLADLIANIRRLGPTSSLRREAERFNRSIWRRQLVQPEKKS